VATFAAANQYARPHDEACLYQLHFALPNPYDCWHVQPYVDGLEPLSSFDSGPAVYAINWSRDFKDRPGLPGRAEVVKSVEHGSPALWQCGCGCWQQPFRNIARTSGHAMQDGLTGNVAAWLDRMLTQP